MTIDTPLTPHLEQFVCEQLATGRFQSKNDVIRAALAMLEEQIVSKDWPTRDTAVRMASSRPQPPSKEFWDGLRATLRGDSVPAKDATATLATRRSPRGILADLPSHISLDDIKKARSDMWTGFPQGRAG